ncbi:hypothetical protein ACEPPN_000510 [Leptodophora sp. 'Broadleaf-Isolate-01']
MSAADSNHQIDQDETGATNTGGSPGGSRQLTPQRLDDFVYLSIETPAEETQTARTGFSLPQILSQHKQSHRKTEAKSPGLPLPFASMELDVGESKLCEFETNGEIFQYLFEPTGQLLPGVVSSDAAWKIIIRDVLRGMLNGVPLDKPVVSTIGAPFFNNQYVADELDFLEVLWQKSFVVARRINRQQRGETGHMRTFLREQIEGLVAGRCEQNPRAQDVQLSVNANGIFFNSNSGNLRNSPPPKLKQINLRPSPSPELMVPLPAMSDTSRSSTPPRPSYGDSILVSFMGNGNVAEIARKAGLEILASAAEAGPNKGPKRELRKESRKELRKELRKEWSKALGKALKKALRKALRKELKKGLRKELRKEWSKALGKALRKELRKELKELKTRSVDM